MSEIDTIRIENIEAFGYHGVFPEERERGQNFGATVELGLPLAAAGRNDDLEQTVDYVAVINAVKSVLAGTPMQTIEAVAENAVTKIFAEFPLVRAVVLTVHKPEAPIADFGGRVSVTIRRKREE